MYVCAQGEAAATEISAGPMVPPWGLMLTRPGVTAMRAGAIFSPWGWTLTPTGKMVMSTCASGATSTIRHALDSAVQVGAHQTTRLNVLAHPVIMCFMEAMGASGGGQNQGHRRVSITAEGAHCVTHGA